MKKQQARQLYDQLHEYGQRPRARRSDPVTSQEAADSLANLDSLRASQQAVLVLLQNTGGMADHLLVELYDLWQEDVPTIPTQSPSGLRTRRKELTTMGLVYEKGYTYTASGRRAIVWAAISTTDKEAS